MAAEGEAGAPLEAAGAALPPHAASIRIPPDAASVRRKVSELGMTFFSYNDEAKAASVNSAREFSNTRSTWFSTSCSASEP